MPSKNAFLRETDELRSLRVLKEIEKDPSVSQRELADRLGVALGIANACVHTLVRKGMVKIRGENNRSITYHLTRKGVVQKSQLAAEWTRNTISFYAHARQTVSEEIGRMMARGVRSVVVYGTKELAEIALVVAADCPEVSIVGVIHAEGEPERVSLVGVEVSGFEILESLSVDAVLLCAEPDGLAREELVRARNEDGPAEMLSLYDKTV